MDDAYMLMSLINTNHANELECIVLHSASSANILLFGCKWSKVLYCHTSEIIHHLSSRETTLYEGGKFHWMAKVRESHPMNDVRQEIESYISDS